MPHRCSKAGAAAVLIVVAVMLLGACEVGPEGGRFAFYNGAIVVVVPAGAVAEPVEHAAVPIPDPLPDPRLVPGTGHEVAPAGGWLLPVTVTIAYDPDQLPIGTAEADLRIVRDAGDTWVAIPGSVVDPGADTVTVSTTALGRVAVAPASAESVHIEQGPDVYLPFTRPTPDTFAYGAADLSATAVDAEGRSLQQPVAWSVADTAVATVDADGGLQGVAAGTTTVSASAQGNAGPVGATTSLCVSGRATASILQPSGGTKSVGALDLDASSSPDNCGQWGLPFHYIWDCSSTTSNELQQCIALEDYYSDPSNWVDPTPPTLWLNLNRRFDVSLVVCVDRSLVATCAPIVSASYFGAA